MKGVGANGFTQMFYMTNYCWENMKHSSVKDYNHSINGNMEVLQVTDGNYKKDSSILDPADLTYIKVYPYVMMAYCFLMFLPYLLWSSMYVRVQICSVK